MSNPHEYCHDIHLNTSTEIFINAERILVSSLISLQSKPADSLERNLNYAAIHIPSYKGKKKSLHFHKVRLTLMDEGIVSQGTEHIWQ